MPNWLTVLLIGGTFGLIFGYFVSQKSAEHKPIRGGGAASLFHYLGASLFVSAGPTVLVGSIFFRIGFLPSLALAFGLLASAMICLIIMAALETSATPA